MVWLICWWFGSKELFGRLFYSVSPGSAQRARVPIHPRLHWVIIVKVCLILKFWIRKLTYSLTEATFSKIISSVKVVTYWFHTSSYFVLSLGLFKRQARKQPYSLGHLKNHKRLNSRPLDSRGRALSTLLLCFCFVFSHSTKTTSPLIRTCGVNAECMSKCMNETLSQHIVYHCVNYSSKSSRIFFLISSDD